MYEEQGSVVSPLFAAGLWMGSEMLDSHTFGMTGEVIRNRLTSRRWAEYSKKAKLFIPDADYGNVSKPWWSMDSLEEYGNKLMMRSVRGRAFSSAGHKIMQGNWKGAAGAFKRSMKVAGIKPTAWNISKMVLGSVGRTASIYYNATWMADMVTGVLGAGISYLQEVGKPKDVTPRYFDSPFNATMRQSSLMAIHSAQLQTRSAFGREAAFLHS